MDAHKSAIFAFNFVKPDHFTDHHIPKTIHGFRDSVLVCKMHGCYCRILKNLLLCSVQSCFFVQSWPGIFLVQCQGGLCNVGAAVAATSYHRKINRSKIKIAKK